MRLREKMPLAVAALLIFTLFSFAAYNFGRSQGLAGGAFPLHSVSFVERRTIILDELSNALNAAKLEGKYGCCIEPACDMCYFGHWLWSDGQCRCDEMIANGELDKVCPQCKKGIEEGRCTSSSKGQICPAEGIFNNIE